MRLSTMAALVRKGINFLLIFAVLYYIFILAVLPMLRNFSKNLFPSKDAPTVLYGKLDPLEFTPKPLLNSQPVYELNTKNGKLPSFPDRMVVFKYKPWVFSYSDGPTALKNAELLGFTEADLATDLKSSTSTLYSWRNAAVGSTLDIKVHSKELLMNTPLIGRYDFYVAGAYTETTAISAAKNLFLLLGRFDDPTYKSGTQTVYFGRVTNSGITVTENPREAHVVKVDLFRTIGKVPVYGPDPKKGLLEAYIARPGSDTKAPTYPRVEAYYWELEGASNATYPLLPIDQAWSAVSKGKGIVASVISNQANPFSDYRPTKVDKVLVNNISLAYYDTPKQQKYMQPVYVFDGNYTTAGGDKGSITLYYPAVSGQWINSPTSAPTENSVKSN